MADYKIHGKTKKYALVEVDKIYRVECLKGPLANEIPHIEIPKELFEQLYENLTASQWAEKGEKRLAKQEGDLEFDDWNDQMWDMEWDAMED